MGTASRNFWQRFKHWWIERWKPWIAFYTRERERKGSWYKYGLPAAILMTLIFAVVGAMLRFAIVPMQYKIPAIIAYIVVITVLSAIVVVTSMKSMGKKLSLFFFIIALVLVSIAILAYWFTGR